MDKLLPGLSNLPIEIIEQILRCDSISYQDVCSISLVSQIFNCVGKSNKLWQKKYQNIWPELASLHDVYMTDWKQEFRLRFECKKNVYQKLEEMSDEFYYIDNVSNDSFFDFRDICTGHPLADHMLIDELERIIYDSNDHLNLTHKYYAKRALRYMRHTLLERVWEDYITNRLSNLSLIKGACLISRWCQPTKVNCTANVSAHLNHLIEMVFAEVQKVSPNHPIIKAGLTVVNLTDDVTTSEESLWKPHECRTILCAINEVMFSKNNFFGNSDQFFSAENSYIDQVLVTKAGIPITLAIVYETIAAHMGVVCLPVNFPGHFLLKWLEHPHLQGEEAYTFIDVYSDGAFKSCHSLDTFSPAHSFTSSWLDAVTPLKVFTRMCWNLVEVGRQRRVEGEGLLCMCNALELLTILSPNDMEHKLLLARVYMHLCINMTRVMSLLQEISEHDPISTGIVGYMYRTAMTTLESQKSRKEKQKVKHQLRKEAPNVEYAVGMIMRHKKYNYRCVIYSWDNICSASSDWIKQMGVHNLLYQDKQPFYLVLGDDGTNRYAAQENLELDSGNLPIKHIEVGRYFESFHGTYYLPNSQKLLEYPEDMPARERMLASLPQMVE